MFFLKPVLNIIVVFVAVILLSACGSTNEELEQEGKPLPLEKFEKKVKLKQLWNKNIGAGQGKHYNKLIPGVSSEGVCAADVKGRVVCFDHQGEKQWQKKLGEELLAGAGIAGERVLVATANGWVVALSREDGKELWWVDLRSEVLSAPQGTNQYVVVQTSDGRLFGLSASNGEKVWEYNSDEPLLTLRGTAMPVVVDDVVYTGFASGKVAALSIETGDLLWDIAIALAKGTAEIERIVDVDASPTVASDAVYAASFNGYLFAISRRNGSPRWRFETSSYREVVVSFGKVYLVDERSRVYAIDEKDGEQRWEQSVFLNRELSAPVVFAGFLLVADYKGYIHILSQVDGSVVGRKRIDSSGVRVPMQVFAGQLYVYANDGELAAYTLEQIDAN